MAVGLGGRNEELKRHGSETLSRIAYLRDPAFISSVFENWESEFLQMAMYVVLTAFLFQRGSSESNDPDQPRREHGRLAHLRSNSPAPAPARGGPVISWLYAHSLGSVLFALFLISFVLHWIHSAKAAAAEALEHGEQALGVMAYLGDPQLWFESFQNWQSEFLSTAVLVVLSIFLRQKNSPESKPIAAPNGQTGESDIRPARSRTFSVCFGWKADIAPTIGPLDGGGGLLRFVRVGLVFFHSLVLHVLHHQRHHVAALSHICHHFLTHGGIGHHRVHVFHALHAFHGVAGRLLRWRGRVLVLRSLNCGVCTCGRDRHSNREPEHS